MYQRKAIKQGKQVVATCPINATCITESETDEGKTRLITCDMLEHTATTKGGQFIVVCSCTC